MSSWSLPLTLFVHTLYVSRTKYNEPNLEFEIINKGIGNSFFALI